MYSPSPPTNLPATVNMIAAAIRFPVVFISGTFTPLDELPSWGRAIAYISPLTYFTDIARQCTQGRGHLSPSRRPWRPGRLRLPVPSGGHEVTQKDDAQEDLTWHKRIKVKTVKGSRSMS